jgi:ferric iron reductase protein FhuF
MNLGKINLITPPDSLFNSNISYLLVKPSTKLKVQFQTILSAIDEEINVYIYDNDVIDIQWMLNAANNVDVIIVDIDNCDPITKNFVALMLSLPITHYLTADETIPWNLISRNRIYNLDWLVEQIKAATEDSEDDNDDEESDER